MELFNITHRLYAFYFRFTLFVFAISVSNKLSGQESFESNNRISFSAGYGTQGLGLALDLKLNDLDLNNDFTGSIKGYMSFNTTKKQFAKSTFIFNNITYASDVRLTNLGIGVGADLKRNRFCVYPFAGLKYYYVRFTDQKLVDAIGTGGLIRYHYDFQGYKQQVGPEVTNGYGDAVALDAGLWVGANITPVLEIGGLLGASQVTFSTAQSLFGIYWGEAPYPNDYYVQIKTVRSEVRIRLNF